jgi:hypothetical protein
MAFWGLCPICWWRPWPGRCHHNKAFAAFGDILIFYDAPAHQWLRLLRYLRRRIRQFRLGMAQPAGA